MIQQTIWNEKDEMMSSEYGDISYYSWLEKEKSRIENGLGRVAEIRHQVNDIGIDEYALFVNNMVETVWTGV
jgi:hypothetical protein